MPNSQIEALAEHLGIDVGDVTSSLYSENTFDADGGQYLVLTDEDADKMAEERILDSAWLFHLGFLAAHCVCPQEALSLLQEKLCEGANETILRMIDDKDAFVAEAIRADGRARFLAQYDGEEHVVGKGEEAYFIYRTNWCGSTSESQL